MPITPDRSKKLRNGLAHIERISTEVQATFTQLEDALTGQEERERRRSQRDVNSHLSDKFVALRTRKQ